MTGEKVTINLNTKARIALNQIAESELITKTDTINRALSIFECLLKHQNQGGQIILRHSDGTDERLRFL